MRRPIASLRWLAVFAPLATAMAQTPPGSADQPAAHAANWDQVEGVYFRSASSYGVGGMVTIDYRPLVFFRDGSYYEVEGEALEDVDLGESKRKSPKRWGRWSKVAEGFTLTNAEGRSSEMKLQRGNIFVAFPGSANEGRLDGRFRRIAGGGNTATGGGVMIATRTNLDFTPDGGYSREASAGASSSGSDVGGDRSGVSTTVRSKSKSGPGRYAIDHHTITLIDAEGRTERRFFAFGSKQSPPQLETGLIFVGNLVFSRRR